MLVTVSNAGAEYVVMADFICQVVPIGLFVLPILAEQTRGEDRRVHVLAPVFLNFQKLVDLLEKHVVGGDALWILESAEQNALRPAVMIRKGLDCRIEAVEKFVARWE